jgi:hypothetical protein
MGMMKSSPILSFGTHLLGRKSQSRQHLSRNSVQSSAIRTSLSRQRETRR